MWVQFLLSQIYQHSDKFKQYEPIIIEYLRDHLNEWKPSLVIDKSFLETLQEHIKKTLIENKQEGNNIGEPNNQNIEKQDTKNVEIKIPEVNKMNWEETEDNNSDLINSTEQTKTDQTVWMNNDNISLSPEEKNEEWSQTDSVTTATKPWWKFKWFFRWFILCFFICVWLFVYQFIIAPTKWLPRLDMEKLLENIRIQKVFAPTK